MAGTVIVPWYATGFRADGFEQDLNEVAATALRYGASSYAVYRSRDDRYRFQQLAAFEEYLEWERFWEGPEMTFFRTSHSSWYQVPVLYGWWDLTAHGRRSTRDRRSGNGHGNGVARRRARRARRAPSALLERRHRQARALQLLPVVLGGLLMAAVDDRPAGGVDHVGDLHAPLRA